jgi:mannose-1-phosphate guanylyltransferase
MLPLATLPVTEHQIAMLHRAGIKKVVLATAYLAEVFIPYFADGSKWGIEIIYAVEFEPLGTGGAIKNAAQYLSGNSETVILNGDVLSSHDLAAQLSLHRDSSAEITLHLTKVKDARAYGCVPVDENGQVKAFLEKMDNPIADTINAGTYIFSPSVIDSIPKNQVLSVERDTFPEAIKNNRKIMGYVAQEYWLDIGTPAALMKGSRDLVTNIADADALDKYQFAHRSADFVSMSQISSGDISKIKGGSAIGGFCNLINCSIEGSIISDGVEAEDCTISNSFIDVGAKLPKGMAINNSFVDIDGEIYPFS